MQRAVEVPCQAMMETFDRFTGVCTVKLEVVGTVRHVVGCKYLEVRDNMDSERKIIFPLKGKLTVYSKFIEDGKLGVRHHDTRRNLMLSNSSDPAAMSHLLRAMSRTKGHKSKQPLAPPKAASQPEVQVSLAASLTTEQQRVVDLIKRRKSVFFTGSAGTGKTWLLSHLLKALPKAGTAVTASTGVAACAIGGSTIHTFAGITATTAENNAWDDEIRRVARNAEAVKRWRTTKLLVIDEVSMMDSLLFSGLARMACALRGNGRPFGGMQLVLCGDFFQLPPVSKRGEARKFCFEAEEWKACVPNCVELTKVFRQSEGAFVDILNDIRWGKVTDAALDTLNQRWAASISGFDDGILPTLLFTHRHDVDRVNGQLLEELPGRSVRHDTHDWVGVPYPVRFESQCPAKACIVLKENAQVILVKSVSPTEGLTNGARGIVTGFSGAAKFPVVRFVNGKELVVRPETWSIKAGGRVVATRKQLPLSLAWGLSIHKSQGMTLDRVEVCLARCFEYGQAYVALSRATSLHGLVLRSKLERSSIRAHPKALEFMNNVRGNPPQNLNLKPM